MAADQRRKRVNGANIAGHGSREQQRIKRKNLGLVQNDLNMRSHISVEWDGNQKKVVAKREQVGISWRQTKPFINSVANGHKLVADVLTVPQEIFDLDNLSDVLSYEVIPCCGMFLLFAVENRFYFDWELCLNHPLCNFRQLAGLDDPSFRK